MARFFTICSSSSGNAAYIGCASYGILIDAGVSYDDALNTMIDIVMTGIVTEKGAKSK